MPCMVPRRDWHSSMTVPTNSLGVRIVARTTGSETEATLPRELAGVGHRVRGAVLHGHLVDHGGGGGDDVQVELALQAKDRPAIPKRISRIFRFVVIIVLSAYIGQIFILFFVPNHLSFVCVFF